MFCEQCGTQIGANENFCQKCLSTQIINSDLPKNKTMFFSAIIGCSVIFIWVIMPLFFGHGIHSIVGRLQLQMTQITIMCGIIAIVLSFIGWRVNGNIFGLIAGVMYVISAALGIINIMRLFQWGVHAHMGYMLIILYNIHIALIIPAIMNIIAFFKYKKSN